MTHKVGSAIPLAEPILAPGELGERKVGQPCTNMTHDGWGPVVHRMGVNEGKDGRP